MRCPTCMHETLETKHGDYLEDKYLIKDTEWEECSHCGEKLFGPKILEELDRAYYVNNDLIFPEEIKRRRKDCRKTQQELADAVGVSENSIKRWEKGSYIQPIDKNIRIEMVLRGWENEKISTQSIRTYIQRLKEPQYIAEPAFAAHSKDNSADIKEIKKLLVKVKK